MSVKKYPGWLRALDVVLGIIAILLAIVVLAFPGLAILTLIIILTIALLIIGIGRILFGIFKRGLSGGARALNIIVGILALILAFVILLYPGIATLFLVYYLAVSLLFTGIAMIGTGGTDKSFPSWLRGLLITVGISIFVISVVVIIFPALGLLTLLYIISINFLLYGIGRIFSGVTGVKR